MIYLASPYSDPDYTIRETRYRAARNLVFHLAFTKNLYIFSPIVYAHRAALDLDLPTEAKPWESMNNYYQGQASALWLLTLPGWQESIGVTAELNFAKTRRQDVHYIDPTDYTISE